MCLRLRIGQAAIVGGGVIGHWNTNSGVAAVVGSNIVLWVILIVALLMLPLSIQSMGSSNSNCNSHIGRTAYRCL